VSPTPCSARLRACLIGVAALASQGAMAGAIEEQAQQFAQDAAASAGARVEVVVGSLDPRLRLAPCRRVEPYLPNGTRLWGRSRIGLRCVEGPTPWNVYLPLTVKVFGRGLVAARALPAGTVLSAADLQAVEVDLAAAGLPLQSAEFALGRTLGRPLDAGQALRPADLRARQWFAAGDTVQILAVGSGFQISGEGQALGAGLEGQPARVRLEGGRIVSGTPVAERRVEIRL
jgi:flagellar basal body P-ring formation protein FlgA